MIPDEALKAGELAALGRYLNKETVRRILQAAGPHLMAQVSTVEELDALWLGSVVLSEGVAYQRYSNDEWAAEGRWYGTGQVELPATVLHNPRTARGEG